MHTTKGHAPACAVFLVHACPGLQRRQVEAPQFCLLVASHGLLQRAKAVRVRPFVKVVDNDQDAHATRAGWQFLIGEGWPQAGRPIAY